MFNLKEKVKANVEAIKKAFGKKETKVVDFDSLNEEFKEFWREYRKKFPIRTWEEFYNEKAMMDIQCRLDVEKIIDAYKVKA